MLRLPIITESIPLTFHPSCFGMLIVIEFAGTLPIFAMEKEVSPFEAPENVTSKSVFPPIYTPALVAISFSSPVIESSYFKLN